MAKPIFFSFYYKHDVHRVQLVQNIHALEGQPVLNAQEWEKVKSQGSKAIQNWIDEKMKYKKAVIVLIGRHTSTRPWVKYEIEKAWSDGRPLLGVRIHGISSMGTADSPGANPFEVADVPAGKIQVFDPTRTDWQGRIDTKATYSNLVDNLEGWSGLGATAS